MDAPWRIRTKLIQGVPGPTKLTSGHVDWTPGTIASGAFASVAVPVVNAVVGQTALGAVTQVLPAGVIAFASVTSSGNARLTIFNFSGSPVTIPDSTAWVDVLVH